MSVMELVPVFRTDWSSEDDRNRHSFRPVKSTWSPLNQVAFTSHGSGENIGSSNIKWSNDDHYIHIVDPNKPWDVHSMVTGHTEIITDLQWSPSGTNLLSVDSNGVFKLWTMKNGLVNDWLCERSVYIEDKIVCMSWLGTSAKYLFGDVQQNLNQLMGAGNSTQSFPRNKAKHPLTNLCGLTREGWIAVTETGKIGWRPAKFSIQWRHPDGQNNLLLYRVCFISVDANIPVSKTQIDTDLQGVQVGDIALSNDGFIILGLADGLVGSVARFYKVSLNCRTSNVVNITCLALQTLSPYSNKSSHPYSITHIRFVYKNSGDHVLICSKGLLESYIERWQLNVEPQQLHELCQKQQPHRMPPPIRTWAFFEQHVIRKHIVSLALPWLPVELEQNQTTTYPRYNLILGFADGHIRALNSLNLSIEGELKSLDSFTLQSHSSKKLKTSFSGNLNAFLSLHYSPCSCCIMGITGNGSLYLFKCEQSKAVSHLHNSMTLKNLLKYCLVSGWEYWDVMVELKHQHDDILDATLRLFEQEYKNLQHSQISRKYLSIKASLLSLLGNSEAKVLDCYSKQFLLTLSNFFKSLISPVGAERLIAICQQTAEVDVEVVFQNLDLKEFEVDSGVLKVLQPLSQWLADFCLSFIGALFIKQGREVMPGASLMLDNQCISLSKQLLLLMLIWSKQWPGILPYCITVVEKYEYVVHLFRLVSRLWMANHQALDFGVLENSISELELHFSNHLNYLYQSMLMSHTNQGVTSKQAYLKPDKPDEYKFGEQPRDRMLPLRLLTSEYNSNIDVVTKQFLGNASDTKLRQCTKCDGISLLMPDDNHDNPWDQKWTMACMCGGVWKRVRPS